jgi:hypothetical protein
MGERGIDDAAVIVQLIADSPSEAWLVKEKLKDARAVAQIDTRHVDT